jgi:hypothetical protein
MLLTVWPTGFEQVVSSSEFGAAFLEDNIGENAYD